MGDVIDVQAGQATLVVRVTGTDAIDNIKVRNGLNTIKTIRPYKKKTLVRGSRLCGQALKLEAATG